VLNSTYFSFNKTFYRQIVSTLMGSPLSSILANIVLQDIEIAFDRLSTNISFYFRYVDDILFVAPHNCLEEIKNIFNSFYERLQLPWKL